MTLSDDPRRVSRRTFLRGVGAAGGTLLAGAALSACGGAPAPAADATAAPAAGGAADATAAPAAAEGGAINLQLWTFADTHARWFQAMADDYKKVNPGFNLTITQTEYAAMHDKLQIALQSGGVGAPDIADIEQGRFGGFLRGDNPGLVDLSDRLASYKDQMVETRQALYSYQGKIYGVEHALCPVVLYYRSDVWEAAGADPAKFATWDDYIGAAKQVSKDDVKAINFPQHDVVLRQRGADYFDKDGKVTLDSELSIETAQWILDLRDKHGIAAQDPGNGFGDALWAATKEGKFLSFVGADWYGGIIRDSVPDLQGKWKAVALPAFEAGGLRTSCWGGTGNSIVSTSKNVEEAWKFMEYTMLSADGNARRFQIVNLFPPFKPAYTDPRLHEPNEYFSNQDLGQLFADLAPTVPAQYQSPFRAELNNKLGPLWQDIYDGKLKPADAFKQVADEIRQAMEAA